MGCSDCRYFGGWDRAYDTEQQTHLTTVEVVDLLNELDDRVESLESMFYDILNILANDLKFKKTMKEEMKEYVEEFGIENLKKVLDEYG